MNKKDEQYCRRIVEQLLYTGERVPCSVAPCTMPRKGMELLTKSTPYLAKLSFANMSSIWEMAHSEVRQHSHTHERMQRPHEQSERETESPGDTKCIQPQTTDHTLRHPGKGMELKGEYTGEHGLEGVQGPLTELENRRKNTEDLMLMTR